VEPKDCRISWVCPLFQGPSLCRVSSVELAWSGVTVERHLVGAGEHTGADLNRHFIVLWDVHPYRGERPDDAFFRQSGVGLLACRVAVISN